MARIRIIFKSGMSQDIDADKFELTYTGESVTGLTWSGTVPQLMFISLPEIAAIFELEKKGWFG